MEENSIYIQDLKLSTSPIGKKGDPETSISVIDGDGFGFLVGWHFSKEFTVTPELVSALNSKVDNFITTILADSQADYYIGILEAEVDYTIPDEEYTPTINFRHKYATTKGYKAGRPEKPEWYKIWGPIVQKRLVEHWRFQRVAPEVEADDLVASLALQLKATSDKFNIVVCGNDKDLHQIPCIYYDYRKNDSWIITELDAVRSLYKQVLMGDTTDNIPGLKGIGKGKATTIVENPKFTEKSGYMYALKEFVTALGEDLGIQSFHENYMLCKLRPNLPISSYKLHKFDPKESETMIQMRELLGDTEMEAIIKEHKVEEVDFSVSNDLFKA